MLKQAAISTLRRLSRGYLRYAPLPFGKRLVLNKIYRPYICWRPYSTIAKTRFGAKIEVNPLDLIQERIYLFGEWEPAISDLITSSLSAGDIFIDIGANVGYYTLLASRMVQPNGRVFCIEAMPPIYSVLQRNLRRNCATNVEAINAAVLDREAEIEVFLASDQNFGASTVIKDQARSEHMTSQGRVRCAPLDALIPPEHLFQTRMIKIDVEGAEPMVLKPLLPLLDKFSDRTEWIIELNPTIKSDCDLSCQDVIDGFAAHGYKAYKLTNTYAVDEYLTRRHAVQCDPFSGPIVTMTDLLFSKHAL